MWNEHPRAEVKLIGVYLQYLSTIVSCVHNEIVSVSNFRHTSHFTFTLSHIARCVNNNVVCSACVFSVCAFQKPIQWFSVDAVTSRIARVSLMQLHSAFAHCNKFAHESECECEQCGFDDLRWLHICILSLRAYCCDAIMAEPATIYAEIRRDKHNATISDPECRMWMAHNSTLARIVCVTIVWMERARARVIRYI